MTNRRMERFRKRFYRERNPGVGSPEEERGNGPVTEEESLILYREMGLINMIRLFKLCKYEIIILLSISRKDKTVQQICQASGLAKHKVYVNADRLLEAGLICRVYTTSRRYVLRPVHRSTLFQTGRHVQVDQKGRRFLSSSREKRKATQWMGLEVSQEYLFDEENT